jgi:hypothetical protein
MFGTEEEKTRARAEIDAEKACGMAEAIRIHQGTPIEYDARTEALAE